MHGAAGRRIVDPIPSVQEKARALASWLHSHGCSLPESAIKGAVVMTHPWLRIEGRPQDSDHLIAVSRLQDMAVKYCAYPPQSWWAKAPPPKLDLKTLTASLRLLRRFDQVILHGGLCLKGELELSHIQIVGGGPLKRARIREARIEMWRYLFPGIFFRPRLKVTDWDGHVMTYRLDPSSKLILTARDGRSKEEILLINAQELSLGWRE
jgi:hypothetical protein